MADDSDVPTTESLSEKRSRRRRSSSRIVTSLFVLLVLGCFIVAVGTMWTHPYYALAPGSVRDTASKISVEKDEETYPPSGEIGFVTVSLRERVNTFEYFQARFDDSIDLVDEELINGDGTSEEKREEDRRRMQESKDTATVVALRYLGYEVPEVNTGVEIVGLTPCMPAEGVLKTGDLIVGIEDVVVTQTDDLTAELDELDPGDEVQLSVDRFDTHEVEDVTLELGSNKADCLTGEFAPQEDTVERAWMGVTLHQLTDYELPFDVVIDSERVGGPSAGLAFALSLIDVMTPGELTGGADVATTGTIEVDGTVGPVGGVKQKTVAAREAGVKLFLVPVGEGEDALPHAGDDMEVVEVETLEEAIDALGEAGGDVEEITQFAAASGS